MKRPDNIVYNEIDNSYDAFKKHYPTSFNSKNFQPENINDLNLESQPYFRKRFFEIKELYEELTEKLKWNNIISRSKYSFNPIIGIEYYLYRNKKTEFLSMIKPNEWEMPYIGTFILNTDKTWQKID
jgi:hypothetical protein